MLDNEEYPPCVNPKISSFINKIGVGTFRSESCWDINPDNPQDGKALILNGLFTLNSSRILNNVPLNPRQVTALMQSMQDLNIVHLDLSGNEFDNEALSAILTNLPQSVKELNLNNNNFTGDSIKLLKDFNASHPNCNISTIDEILGIDTLDFTLESITLGEDQSTTSQSEFGPQA